MPFSLASLSTWPDVESPDLVAVDAADRLILDESAEARRESPGAIVVIGDRYGALALGSILDGATGIRVHQDAFAGRRALAANAARGQLADAVTAHELDAALVREAAVVLLRLPKSLDQLRDAAGLIAAHAAPGVRVFAGGRIKHMSLAMNEVLGAHFDRVDVTHARQKSRVLIASGPHDGHDPVARTGVVDGLTIAAYGGVFAGPTLDIGTRFLLEHLPDVFPGDLPLLDLACGTGVVGAWLARRHPDRSVYASDASAAAVRSARATAAANGVAERVSVAHDDALSSLAAGSSDAVVLNPPFHADAALHTGLAAHLFADAARVLRPGGELWTVWNSALQYRPQLERIVGPTRQIARNTKFTVTASTKR